MLTVTAPAKRGKHTPDTFVTQHGNVSFSGAHRRLQTPPLGMGIPTRAGVWAGREYIIDIFGKEHDSFMSSLQDFAFYMVGGVGGIIVVTVVR